MRIVAHDEDSMTNLFFSEVHRHDKLKDFLALIEWRSSSVMPFDVADAELHQQVNLSEFGRPDAIILVTSSNGQRHVVIVEVKLGKYLDSCETTGTGRFENRSGLSSRLNYQLALKYRAMISLPSIRDQGFITEMDHVAKSPYHDDKVRRCKKRSTIELFRSLAGGNVSFCLVTLTSDRASPLNEARLAMSDPCFPLLFNQRLQAQQEFRHLGSVLWRRCLRLFDGVDNHVAESFALHLGGPAAAEEPTEAPREEELFVRGRQIVKYAGMTCHLACQGYSFTVRHFRDGRFVSVYEGRGDREKYLGLESQIQVLGRAPRTPLADAAFWASYFLDLDSDGSTAPGTPA